MTGNRWADLVILLAALLTAAAVVWRKLVVPAVHLLVELVDGVRTFQRVAPVLVKIGEEFHGNGGTTLKDTLNRIEAGVADKSAKLDTLYEYSHRWRHNQANDMQKLVLADDVITKKLDALVAATQGKQGA